jgi:DNA-binding transcriptional LysR family regulator
MATAKYFEKRGKPKTLDDLLEHDCVILQRDGKLLDEWTFRRGATDVPMKVRGRLKVTSGEGLREAVLSDLGIAIVSEWLFSPELTSGAVDAVLSDWSLPTQDLWSVFPTGKRVSAKARAFVAYVERCMAAPSATSPIVLRSLTA